jgi:hypothetical protein
LAALGLILLLLTLNTPAINPIYTYSRGYQFAAVFSFALLAFYQTYLNPETTLITQAMVSGAVICQVLNVLETKRKIPGEHLIA